MGRREIARKFDEIVDFAEIERFIDTPVKRYSSGMYVRLAFAVAAHMEPDILLIDEVLSVGDLAFQRKCMDHAKRLLERDATLLFVSHNMFAIKAMCRRAIYLSQGKVVLRWVDRGGHSALRPGGSPGHGGRGRRGWWAPTPRSARSTSRTSSSWTRMGSHASSSSMARGCESACTSRRRRPCASPNFTSALIRSDDVACCNYNTAMDGFPTATVSGSGVIELLTPPIKLVADLYSIQVLVWDPKFQRLYCAQIGKNFHVSHPDLSTEFGVFHEAAEWCWGGCSAVPRVRYAARATRAPIPAEGMKRV